MANPDNALGTNGAYGGRTSVNAFNDVLAGFTGRGILSGWECVPDTGLTVTLGGNGTDRDVALAEDNSGNKTTVNNISQAPVPATLPAAPATNSRIDAIVAYIESSPSTNAETDNYSAVNLLVVSGTAASAPIAPTDSNIRTAITADGASGATAYYVVLATVKLPSGTTDIDATMISSGPAAQISAEQIGDSSITSDKIDFTTFKRWVPDYNNTSSTNLVPADETSVTIQQTGFICFSFVRYSNNAEVYMTINGAKVMSGIAGAQGYGQISGIIPIVAGDIIEISYNTDTPHFMYFIPGKWV